MTLKMVKACFLQLHPIVNNKIVFFFCDTHDVQSMFPAIISYIPILVKNKQQVHFFTDILLHMLSQSHLFLSYHSRLACYKMRNIIRHYTDNTTV